MLADITRLELRLRCRSAIGYAAGMALYTLVVVALYPSFKNSTSLNSLSGSTAAALFGVTGQLTSPGGWLNANIYGNFFPLIMLILTIGGCGRTTSPPSSTASAEKPTASSPARAENRRTQPRAVVYGTPAAAAAGRTPHPPPATRPITPPATSAASSRQASANAGSSA